MEALPGADTAQIVIEVDRERQILKWITEQGDLKAYQRICDIQTVHFVPSSPDSSSYGVTVVFQPTYPNRVFDIEFSSDDLRQKFVDRILQIDAAIRVDRSGAPVDRSLYPVTNSKARSCICCRKNFKLKRRRHTCKICNNTVCTSCSFTRINLANKPVYRDSDADRVRICDFCLAEVRKKRVDMHVRPLSFNIPGACNNDVLLLTSASATHPMQAVSLDPRLISGILPSPSNGRRRHNDLGFMMPEGWEAPPRRTSFMPEDILSVGFNLDPFVLWSSELLNNPNLVFSPNLKCLIRVGIPAQFRNRVWPHISGANLLRSLSAPGYYDDLVAGATRAMKVDVVEGIDRELHRTFNGHVWFDRPAGIVPLRRILIAYSIRNPAVGFQSYMNHVGALLLLFLDEENAFWMLCIIVEYLTASNYDWQQQRITNPESTPAGYYYFQEGGAGHKLDQLVFTDLLRQRYRKVCLALDALEITVPTLMKGWFAKMFIGCLPVEFTLRIWDMFFAEGCTAFFKTALAIFDLNQTAIRNSKTLKDLTVALQAFSEGPLSESAFFDTVNSTTLLRGDVQDRRVALRTQMTAPAYNMAVLIRKNMAVLDGVLRPVAPAAVGGGGGASTSAEAKEVAAAAAAAATASGAISRPKSALHRHPSRIRDQAKPETRPVGSGSGTILPGRHQHAKQVSEAPEPPPQPQAQPDAEQPYDNDDDNDDMNEVAMRVRVKSIQGGGPVLLDLPGQALPVPVTDAPAPASEWFEDDEAVSPAIVETLSAAYTPRRSHLGVGPLPDQVKVDAKDDDSDGSLDDDADADADNNDTIGHVVVWYQGQERARVECRARDDPSSVRARIVAARVAAGLPDDLALTVESVARLQRALQAQVKFDSVNVDLESSMASTMKALVLDEIGLCASPDCRRVRAATNESGRIRARFIEAPLDACTFAGHRWHRQCLVCCGPCARVVDPDDACDLDGRPYCPADYPAACAAVCFACGRPPTRRTTQLKRACVQYVTGDIQAQTHDLFLHDDCARCCRCPAGALFQLNNAPLVLAAPSTGTGDDGARHDLFCKEHFAPVAGAAADATCTACHEGIRVEERYLRFNRRGVPPLLFHQRCFACAVCRQAQTLTRPVLVHPDDDRVYCADHVPDAYRCVACRAPVLMVGGGGGGAGDDADHQQQQQQQRRRVVGIDGRFYHRACLQCATCTAAGTRAPDAVSFHARDGVVFCADHYQARFCDRCRACDAYIQGKAACLHAAHPVRFHAECFVCHACRTPIGADDVDDGAVWHDDKLWCARHRRPSATTTTTSAQ